MTTVRTSVEGEEVRGMVSVKQTGKYGRGVEGPSPLVVSESLIPANRWMNVAGFYVKGDPVHPVAYQAGGYMLMPIEGQVNLELSGSFDYMRTKADYDRISRGVAPAPYKPPKRQPARGARAGSGRD